MKKSSQYRYDSGGYWSVLFLLLFLPCLVAYFNPDDCELTEWQLFTNGVFITLLFCATYYLTVKLTGLSLFFRRVLTGCALFLFTVIVFFPVKPGEQTGFQVLSVLDFGVLLDLIKYLGLAAIIFLAATHSRSQELTRIILNGCGAVAVAFLLFFIVQGAMYGKQTKQLLWKRFHEDQVDGKAFIEFGAEKNVIILLWDAVQGKVVEEILNQSPEYKHLLEGFEFFPNAVSSAPLTWRSLPMIYSGRFRENPSINNDIIRKTMYEDSFFSDAKDNGYRVSCKGVRPDLSIGGFSDYESYLKLNSDKSSVYVAKKYLAFLYVCSKRIFPLIVQNMTVPVVQKIRGLLLSKGEEANDKRKSVDYYSKKLANHIDSNKLMKGNYPNKLSYFHFRLAHEPYKTPLGTGYTKEHAKTPFSYCVFTATPEILDKLKELGIYDKSLILVISDHGARVPTTSKGLKINGSKEYDLSAKGFSRYPPGAYNPLVMVKQPFAQGPLKINNGNVLLTDIRDVINVYMNDGTVGEQNLPQIAGEGDRKVKLIVTVDPEIENIASTHVVVEFVGGLKNIPQELSNIQ